MHDDDARTTTVLRQFTQEAGGVLHDLTQVVGWLKANEDELTDADVVSLRIESSFVQNPGGLIVTVHCRNERALARIARTLARGAGKGEVTKHLVEDLSHGHVIRPFGRVLVNAWAVYPCTTETRVVAGAVHTTTNCPPLLSLAGAS